MTASPQSIQDAYARCRRRYPTVDLSLEDWLARSEASGVEFEHLCHEDLFLATACARGNRIAWEYFADDYLPLIRRMAAQACRRFEESEDLAQEIVTSLIAGQGKMAAYSGRGSLSGWLRVAISHAAIDRFRRQKREVPLQESDELEGVVATDAPASGRNSEPLDAHWGPILADILEEQIHSLPARDRLILALYYLQGISLKVIGRQFGVHEATASRWLESLRGGIRKRVERELHARHRLTSSEISGLWRWAAEQEGLSLEASLGIGSKASRPRGLASQSESCER
jgi:RNA polymerase sigma-70 factor